MTDPDNIVQPEHVEFFRRVVALAREHRMNHLHLSFSFGFRHPALERAPRSYATVKGHWSEGRHGDKGVMTFQWDAKAEIPEEKGS